MAYNELDDIAEQAKQAMRLREGVAGSQAANADLKIRLNGGDPALGRALRAQPAPDYSAVQQRLAAPMAETKAVERPLPPRNVPLNAIDDAARPYVQQVAAQPSTNPNVQPGRPSAEARAFMESRQPVQATPTAAVTQPTPAAEPGRITRMAQGAGRMVGRFGPAAVGIDAIAGMGTYQLNEPGVDSSAMGTIRAVGQGDFAGAGRSLVKGAKETAMDLGGTAAGIADVFLPGQPATTAYQGALQRTMGDTLRINATRASIGLPPKEAVAATVDQPGPNGSRVAQVPGGAVLTQRPTVGPQPTAQPTTQAATQAAPTAVRAAGAARPAPRADAISQVAQAAPKADDIRIGETHYIHTQGGRSFVVPYGPGGLADEAIPLQVFQAGKAGEYRQALAQAPIQALTDPNNKLAERRMMEEGATGRTLIEQEAMTGRTGMTEAGADRRKRMDLDAPKVDFGRSVVVPADPLTGTPARVESTPVQVYEKGQVRTLSSEQKPKKETPTPQTIELMKKTIKDKAMRDRFEMRFGSLADYGITVPKE